MRMKRGCAILGAGVVAFTPTYLFSGAPTATAECTESGGITMCQNEVRRADTGPAESDMWYPYPCEFDYLCDDGGSVFDYDSGDSRPPQPPGAPDIGLPGRPGDRPDRPDRPGGGGGIGGGR
ncbi:hypothetical protein [Mycolicibacterium monacense]|uniref:Uncharacterized protein n=4 Tax=Mycobacteriaceae TaxID=1762 RepID=A0AAD1N0T2_MYCMB|nr:hypothetical protein [Mycolicibacterium monacense]MDA4104208.1 hypothetical protein [Mycolicibacterium monacense DSM 44395]OBB73515.1 hypothetical protein A6B34_14920 [Mycolicibacterium monacense]OBF47099.1 hypothetical protein A5778_26615 [Mycolicibacterium monacense]ORB15939.1 hypothetical protein BST34_20355 [Mycolicibacterium monacense DSM 44395]QHP85023.1 hypothetical protein EWR22_06350 [Mycolicibacterium monacense DSM 44395]